jgi:hypothetical protein
MLTFGLVYRRTGPGDAGALTELGRLLEAARYCASVAARAEPQALNDAGAL